MQDDAQVAREVAEQIAPTDQKIVMVQFRDDSLLNADDLRQLIAMHVAPALATARAEEETVAREKVAQWMLGRSFATGHGDTIDDLLGELSWQVAELRAARAFLTGGQSNAG